MSENMTSVIDKLRMSDEDYIKKFALDHPEKFNNIRLETFLSSTPIFYAEQYRGEIASHKIPYIEINSKDQVQGCNHYPVKLLGVGESHWTKGGDLDWVNQQKKYGIVNGKERVKAYKEAVENGADIRVMMSLKDTRKGGQTEKNARTMLNAIGPDSLRCIDSPLYASLTERLGSQGKIKSALSWESQQIYDEDVFTRGFPQPKDRMEYKGYYLDGKSPKQQPVIRKIEAELNHLWKLAEKTKAQDVLDNNEIRRHSSSADSDISRMAAGQI